MRIVLYLNPVADADLIAQIVAWPLGTRSQRIKQAWRGQDRDTENSTDTRIAQLEQRVRALESRVLEPAPARQTLPLRGWGADTMQGLLSGLTSHDEAQDEAQDNGDGSKATRRNSNDVTGV
ncbi:hypothetical protein [Sulfobacillus sp. hq2]|uniref:hypothetical protein n=1 Tax=Sulfobacillus TaxID=28033 RepID=UPI000CD04F86|nr:hypothetical protein [Sulfobacillus sp. hq2]POB12309.1 hypothetical protein CO251_00130 [Sulfobacillus sp. hq2]